MERGLEFAVVLLGTLMILPLFVVVSVIIVAAIGRPVFFTQTRAGLGGVPFRLVKFRTMTESKGPDGRLLDDALRVNAVTKLVRRTRVDEIPQLWSIIRGDMALVGPRPLLPATIAEFGPAGVERCRVRPGLTGWAQVSGNTRLTDSEKLDLDLWYVANRTLALDLRILAETVRVAIVGERRNAERLATASRFRERQIGATESTTPRGPA
jgi:lipopolysaccharide/colanic/teichoic acid biosynthesis glycosyltransferase